MQANNLKTLNKQNQSKYLLAVTLRELLVMMQTQKLMVPVKKIIRIFTQITDFSVELLITN
jgi:hypothetical protein